MNAPLSINDKIAKSGSIKIAEFRKHIRKTKPHKHNKYLELVFFTEGTGSHTIDIEQIAIEPNQLFVVRKDQVHFWDITSEPSGYVILLKNTFVEDSVDAAMKQLLYEISNFTYLFPKDPETVQRLFQLMVEEYENNAEENHMILEGMFKALLGKLLQANHKSVQKNNSLYEKFVALLRDQNTNYTKVEQFAEALHTSPQNLNAVCRKERDKSASEVLSEYTISEANRLLIYSNLNVSEIAHSLNFKDNSHFTKFFKRHAGLTPRNYRENHR